MAGDSVLLAFGSAASALLCALAQRRAFGVQAVEGGIAQGGAGELHKRRCWSL